jgi:hypothetical protein
MRKSTIVCLAIGLVLALASLAWMVYLPGIVERELRAATGFDVRVAVLKVDPFTGHILVMGFTVKNPAAYPTPEFVDLRTVRANVSLYSWFFSDQFVINELDIDTKEIALVRQHNGKSNAGDFMAAFSGGAAAPASKHRTYLVKKLHIRLEELYVADYTGLGTDRKTYKVNIDRSYTNVTDPRQLLVPDVVHTLYSFGFHHDFAKLLPGDFGQALADTVGGVAHVGGMLKSTVEKTGSTLKGAIDKLAPTPKP